MRHQEGSFQSADGTRIYHQTWLPDGNPKAVVILSHGLAEHSSRYTNVAEHLISHDYSVCGLDHIGHGKSTGTRVFVRRFSDYTDVFAAYVHHVRNTFPGLPLFLYAHSVGALIATLYLLDLDVDLSGVVFSGPCVKVPSNVSSMTVFLAKALSRIAPKLGLSAVDASGISRDPKEVQAYIDDPLVYNGKTTARLACELLKAMARVPLEAGSIMLPAFIVHGGEDRIVDPEGAQMLHAALGSKDKTLTIYDGLYHEIHNEPEHPQVLADISAWLDAHLPSDLGD
ncbi:lysophospholipase [Candidatus Bipolaricaulota bacterium]|nr:lysophospholipase [Candidatus Bipolaricaulota bacterium]